MGYRFFRYTKDDGSGNPIFYNRDGTQLAIMEKGTNLTTIEGGSVSGDDLLLKANSIDTRASIRINGTSGVTIDLMANALFSINESGNAIFATLEDGNGVHLKTYSNRNLYLQPDGTGRVRFGAEITNAGSDRGKLINFLLADGTSVHIKTYDTV